MKFSLKNDSQQLDNFAIFQRPPASASDYHSLAWQVPRPDKSSSPVDYSVNINFEPKFSFINPQSADTKPGSPVDLTYSFDEQIRSLIEGKSKPE